MLRKLWGDVWRAVLGAQGRLIALELGIVFLGISPVSGRYMFSDPNSEDRTFFAGSKIEAKRRLWLIRSQYWVRLTRDCFPKKTG